MSACCQGPRPPALDPRYRKVLWIALYINVAMFLVELASGIGAGSVSLLSDSLDFFGDAANYGISLMVLGMGVVARARASLFKAATMGAFGAGVLIVAAWRFAEGGAPHAMTMGVVGFMALLANVGVAWMLFAFRQGDSNMRSVWLCSRNDALSNIAVMLAALGVFGTGSAWPDLLVASVMGLLALSSAWQVSRQAFGELRTA